MTEKCLLRPVSGCSPFPSTGFAKSWIAFYVACSRRSLVAGLGVVAGLGLFSQRIGPQDLSAALLHQPGVSQRWQDHVTARTRSTIQATMLALPRPLGTDMPLVLASAKTDTRELIAADPADFNAGVSVGSGSSTPVILPKVNRLNKTDSLFLKHTMSRPLPAGDASEDVASFTPFPDREGISPADASPSIPEDASPAAFDPLLEELSEDTAEERTQRLLFSAAPIAPFPLGFEGWSPQERPQFVPPPAGGPAAEIAVLAVHPQEESLINSPAVRLGLEGVDRQRADRCLAEAVYFESRGESVKGQQAVAQVVINRVFSPYYPDDVCGVVYQNASHWRACQFTFACDGSKARGVNDRPRWAVALRVARDALDGKSWNPAVGNATHYHAFWVRPWWVRTMTKFETIGVHSFYRPRAWSGFNATPLAEAVERDRMRDEAQGNVSPQRDERPHHAEQTRDRSHHTLVRRSLRHRSVALTQGKTAHAWSRVALSRATLSRRSAISDFPDLTTP